MNLQTMLSSLVLCVLYHVASAGFMYGREEEVYRYLNVDCAEDGMKVDLNFNLKTHRYTMTSSLARSLEKASFNIGNIQKCTATKNSVLKEHAIFTHYSECGVEKTVMEHGVNYTAKVIVNMHPTKKPTAGSVFMYTISCTILNQELNQVRYNLLQNGKPADTTKDVLTAPFNGQFAMEIQPIFSLFSRFSALYTYPSRCWLSSDEDSSDVVTVLDHGCPLRAGEKMMSAVYQREALQYTAGNTVIYLNMIADIFPKKHINLSSNTLMTSFACDVAICSSSTAHRIMGVPLCPSAGPCESPTPRQPLFRAGGRVPPLVRAVLPPRIEVDLRRTALSTPLTTPVRVPDVPELQGDDGLSAVPVAGSLTLLHLLVVAFLSFVAGAIVVSLIWVLHTYTDPSRKSRIPLATAAVSQAERPLVAPYADSNRGLLSNNSPPSAS